MKASSPMEILQEAAEGVERIIKLLKKKKASLVRSKEELQIIKATSLAWFNNYRNGLVDTDKELFKPVEDGYTILFQCSSRATTRNSYQETLKKLKSDLI